MKIDFNNVRKQACIAYDRLVEMMNDSRDEDNDIVLDVNEAHEVMNELRMTI